MCILPSNTRCSRARIELSTTLSTAKRLKGGYKGTVGEEMLTRGEKKEMEKLMLKAFRLYMWVH